MIRARVLPLVAVAMVSSLTMLAAQARSALLDTKTELSLVLPFSTVAPAWALSPAARSPQAPPGAFGKSSPANGATAVFTTATLSWGVSSGATGYEYCFQTSSVNPCTGWISTGMSTSLNLGGVSPNTTFYWQVRATNGTGTTYADGSSTATWNFRTGQLPPGSFFKIGPANGATGVSTSPVLSWADSSGGYEFCYDTTNDNACASWAGTGADLSVGLSGLAAGTVYYWQVRATNPGGTTYANGSATAFWSFTTAATQPGAFGKSAPANGAIGVSITPTLTWGASSGATGYEYCYDTSNDNACSGWTSTGNQTGVGLNGLGAGTSYYWQVRATNGGLTTYAQGSSTAFWSFTTQAASPDIRIVPTSLSFVPASSNQIYVELDWMEDGPHSHKPSQAVIDTIVQAFAREGFAIIIDVSNAIPHQATLAVTGSPSSSASVQALKAAHFNHAGDTRYFYSVWGHNYSLDGAFTTSSGIADLPGGTHLVTLGSFSGSVGTFSNQVGTFVHEFGHNIGQRHGGLDHANYKPNYVSVMNYFYQLNGLGPSLVALQFANTTSGFNTFGYSHGLLPTLNESSLDENLGIGLGRARDWNCDGILSTSLARDIQTSNPCSGGGSLSVLSDYDNWAAINGFVQTGAFAPRHTGESSEVCVTLEDDLPIRTTIALLRALQLLPDESTLTASPSGDPAARNATAQFFDVHNDGTATLNVTGISLDSPALWVSWEPQAFSVAPGASLRVHVYVNSATMPAGQTTRQLLVASNDPDENPYPGGVNLTMGQPVPPAFAKLQPTNGASGQESTNLLLDWDVSSTAASYEYCYDTTNNAACDSGAWTSTATVTGATLPSLGVATTYYWQVRARNAAGTTGADAGAWWSFTTATGPPGAFNKAAPLDGANDRPINALSLAWSSSSFASSYEYCYDTTNNANCDSGVWASTGTAASATLPTLSVATTYYWQVRARNVAGTTNANGGAWWRFTTGDATPTRPAPGDFDGDGKTDHTVFRSADGGWYSNQSVGGPTEVHWGLPTDVEIPGDYDGDGKADIALWRPSNGTWYIRQSQTGTVLAGGWGSAGDMPFAGDVDADGKSDRIIWRPSTGTWYALLSGGGTKVLLFGMLNDVPVVGDWDGDGRADFGIWRPSTGVWYIAYATGGLTAFSWGAGALGDVPSVGDWNGDKRDDFGIWRPGSGTWYIAYSSGGWTSVGWGVAGDVPLMGDWDGDGRTDMAVWRPGNGVWYVVKSGGGISYVPWGLAGDRPIGQRSGR